MLHLAPQPAAASPFAGLPSVDPALHSTRPARLPLPVGDAPDASLPPGAWTQLNRALAPSGGIVTADALADLLRRHTGQGLSQVARWLVAGDLLCLRFHGQTQVPLFQFDLRSLRLRPAVQDLAADTRGVFDGLDLVRWFAEPNAWLGGGLPADRVATDAPAVLAAARADRFIATGWS